jgi:hypothetical protein
MSDWNPDDPVLSSDKAAHETAAVMRWHRAHVPSKKIMKLLNLRGTKLIAKLEQASFDEKQASQRGLDIHDALIYKETN